MKPISCAARSECHIDCNRAPTLVKDTPDGGKVTVSGFDGHVIVRSYNKEAIMTSVCELNCVDGCAEIISQQGDQQNTEAVLKTELPAILRW